MYNVMRYTSAGYWQVVAGCGRHKGTWDCAANSLRTAQRWAAQYRKQWPGSLIYIERV